MSSHRLSSAAFVVAAGMVFGVYARTVNVTSQTDSSVTFAFGDQDGLAHELFVAHGATDGGEDKYAWTSFEKVADIASDQATLEYAVPERLRDGRPMRFFLMQALDVNMAKELVSIRSTGAQWINAGVAPAAGWTIDFRFGDPVYVEGTAFFGRGWDFKRYLFCQQSSKFRFYGENGTLDVGGMPKFGVNYRCVIDPSYTEFSNVSSVLTLTGDDGTESRSSIRRSVAGSGNFAIFGIDNAKLATFTFYRMKIGTRNANNANTVKVRDFIPAVNANGDIGLYDQVNNAFYKNQTATPFEPGDELPQERFGRVKDETPTFRFHRTVSVSSATARAATLAFANPDGAAYKLYVAYGQADCESDKNAWASWMEVRTIAADETSYTYTLPAALKADGVFYRFFLVKTDDLPYASELASITSTGAQTVRLDYIPGTDTTTDLRFGDVQYENSKVLFGTSWDYYCYTFGMQSNKFEFHGKGTQFPDVAPTAGTDYRCRVMGDNSVILDTGENTSQITETRTAYPYSELCVFATYGGSNAAKYRFDSMIVKEGAVVVRDLVPVQTKEGKGALFDRANGRVFENATDTDFTQGEAFERQGWVISTTASLQGSSVHGFIVIIR